MHYMQRVLLLKEGVAGGGVAFKIKAALSN
jgi:hypothetical protein